MEPCRNSSTSKIAKMYAVLLYPTVGILTFFAGSYCIICSFFQYRTDYATCILLFSASCIAFSIAYFMFKMCIACYTFENRKFSIFKNGITLKGKDKSFYSWDEIHEVAIVAYAASASLQNYQTVICCFLEHKPSNFLYRILHSYVYATMNQHSFVIIDYDTAVIHKFELFYPHKLNDYRREQIQVL